MEIKLDKNVNIPYYIQIKNEIVKLIKNKSLTPGQKLPTEREMAEKLQISRNTISMAYKELEDEEKIECLQGKGTFVASEPRAEQSRLSRKDQLLSAIDDAIKKAFNLGFSLDEFLAITHVRAREKNDSLSKLNAAFVECNKEQIDYFLKNISVDPEINVQTILLDELKHNKNKYLNELKQMDLVITTFFHVEEMRALLADHYIEILPIAMELELETIVKLARHHKGTKFGLVCYSEKFAQKFIESINQAGVNHINIEFLTDQNESALKDFIDSYNQILVIPDRKNELLSKLETEKNIWEVIFKPNQASLNLLQTTLLNLKQKVS